MNFYQDEKSGAILEILNGGISERCCGLKELIPNTTEGAQEKHLPVIDQGNGEVVVKVGSIFHPMEDAHSIQWVILETICGFQKKGLKPDSEPKASFRLTPEDQAVSAYAYCNLHGLWKTDL